MRRVEPVVCTGVTHLCQAQQHMRPLRVGVSISGVSCVRAGGEAAPRREEVPELHIAFVRKAEESKAHWDQPLPCQTAAARDKKSKPTCCDWSLFKFLVRCPQDGLWIRQLLQLHHRHITGTYTARMGRSVVD